MVLKTVFMVLALALLLTPGALATPKTGKDTFYVQLTGYGSGWTAEMPVLRLPSALGLGNGAVGFLVINGKIEETDPTRMDFTEWKSCNVPGRTCKGTYKISGIYTGNRLTAELTADEEMTYDGMAIDQGAIRSPDGKVTQIARPPIQPATFKYSSKTVVECDVANPDLMCTATRTYTDRPTGSSTCTKWKEIRTQEDRLVPLGECALLAYKPGATRTETQTVKAIIVTPKNVAIITGLTGEADLVHNGKEAPARVGDVLLQGDAISTGFESSATLDFGYGKLEVWQITQLRLNEFTSEKNLQKTQLYLQIGTVEARLPHTDSIRGDFHSFSINTPTANSAIRNSAMKVSYDNTTQKTTVDVLEDEAYVKGSGDSEEVTVLEGQRVIANAQGKTGKPQPIEGYDKTAYARGDEVNSGSVGPGQAADVPWTIIIGGAIFVLTLGVLMLVGLVVLLKKKPGSATTMKRERK